MNHPYFEKSQSWTMALRTLMGYPADTQPLRTVAWCTSGPRNLIQIMDLACLPSDMARDVVHVAFELDADEPIAVSLAVHRDTGIEWMANVLPYAASDTARIELLADGRSWHVGPRHVLTGAKLPPKDRWEGGIAIARRRWRQTAETMTTVALEGADWVLDGGSYADSIPQEALRVAG